jgi:hypothetical protein
LSVPLKNGVYMDTNILIFNTKPLPMAYLRSEMVFKDYKWNARADHDNPKIIAGTDHNELNRTEGYEMLYFINSLARTWNWSENLTQSYQHLERIIRNEVPSNIRRHGAIMDWISAHYKNV